MEDSLRQKHVKPFIRFERALDKGLSYFENMVSCTAMVIIPIVVLYNIVLRYFLKIPNHYGEELVCHVFVICVFSAVSIGVRSGSHMGITALMEFLPQKAGNVLRAIVRVLEIITYAVMMFFSAQYTVHMYKSMQLSTNLRLPLYWIILFIALGFLLCVIRGLMMFYNDFIDKDHSLEGTP